MVEVYERGQIVIPKYVRDMLNIFPGTHLNIRVEDRKIILEQSSTWFDELKEIQSDMPKYEFKQIMKMIDETEGKRKKELAKDVY